MRRPLLTTPFYEGPTMEILDGPAVVTFPDRHGLGLGLRTVTPFRGMFAVRDDLVASLFTWFRRPAGFTSARTRST